MFISRHQGVLLLATRLCPCSKGPLLIKVGAIITLKAGFVELSSAISPNSKIVSKSMLDSLLGYLYLSTLYAIDVYSQV